MTDFLWRSCDLDGTGARETILRHADIADRAIALLNDASGLPPDTTAIGVDPPAVDVVGASWCSIRNTGRGRLRPGTYKYKLIPLDTCTGATGAPISIPDLTITTLGQEASLCVTIGVTPDPCMAFMLQRDGLLVGNILPVGSQMVDSYPVITEPTTTGTYNNGTTETFDIVSGADLIVGDSVSYANKVVRVTARSGSTVTFDPPIGLESVTPSNNFTNIGARTFAYVPFAPLPIPVPAIPLPFPPALTFPFAINAIDIPIEGFDAPHAGDIVVFGGKTAVVVSATPTPGLRQVMLMPFAPFPPPLPIGLGWIVYRSIPDPTEMINNGVGLYTDGDVNGFTVAGNPVIDAKLAPDAVVMFNGEQKKIGSVAPSGSNTRVTFYVPLDNPPSMTTGIYFVIPEGLSQFLVQTQVAPTGSYQRLTRLTETSMVSGLWQMAETGEAQTRSGALGDESVTARNMLDQMMTQSGYQGLNALFRRVRGPSNNESDRVFNVSNGNLILPTGSNRMFAVNGLADGGNGQILDLARIRALRDKVCGSFPMLTALRQELFAKTAAVVRLEDVSVADSLTNCAPEDMTFTTKTVCRGVASKTSTVKETEKARVFLSNTNTKTSLVAVLTAAGLTKDEATNALLGQATGRVVEVVNVTANDLSRTTALSNTLSDLQADEVLDSTRVVRINTGYLVRDQIQTLIRNRGRAGVTRRTPGTENTNDNVPPVDDLTFSALNLLQLVLQYQGSFDLCDFDAVLDALPAGPARNSVAAVLAVVEGSFSLLEKSGLILKGVLDDPLYRAVTDAIGGLLTAISADPTLGCLIGPQQLPGFGLPGIPNLDIAVADAAAPLSVRLELTQLFAGALNTIVCVIVGQLLKLLPAEAAAGTQRAIGCLPPLDVLDAINIPIDVEVTLQCGFDRLTIIQDLLNAAIAEANEFISFANGFGQGFIFRNVAAQNKSCAGDQNIMNIFDAAANQFGIGNLIGQARVLSATLNGI